MDAVTAAVLMEEIPIAVPVLSLKVQAGAAESGVPKVRVHAVAAVMPVIEPLLSPDPAVSVPLPHEDTTGKVALGNNFTVPANCAA